MFFSALKGAFHLLDPWFRLPKWVKVFRVTLEVVVLLAQLWVMYLLGIVGMIIEGILVGLWLVTVFHVLYVRRHVPPQKLYSTPYIRKYRRQCRQTTGAEPRVEWESVSIEKVSPNLITLVDVSEAGGCFMLDRGFKARYIMGSYYRNRKGDTLSGASSVSQQLAKNLFLPFNRQVWRKVVEIHYTALLVWLWGKKRIMESYINVVELGQGIFGFQAASKHYFHHGVEQLTDEEALMLVCTLPAPRRHNPETMTPFYVNKMSRVKNVLQYFAPTDINRKYEGSNPRCIEATKYSLAQFALWVFYFEIKNFNKRTIK